ncbi:MAG: hypothetical protein HDQ91_07140 [Desulfovibrio sp.]|nr:hypothetical protein [Desulfovibrio sp.]
MKFFEDYPEFNGYDAAYLLRIKEMEPIPNTPFRRSLLNGALKNYKPTPLTLLETDLTLPATDPGSSDWIPYKSPYLSDEEAGIRAAFEHARMKSSNREILAIAKANYDHLYNSIKDLTYAREEDDIRILLLPKLLDRMIERERDEIRKFHLEFLRNSFYLWLSEKVSFEPNFNFLYYPYHMILDYQTGNEAHKMHLQKFFNAQAREVIRNRLKNAGLFSDRKEYFDYTQGHPSNWHSDAHQNTSVKHGFHTSNIDIPQFQALGDYSLGALAKGYTMPAGNGKHYICISNAYSFVNDSFDFEGIQWLGNWDFENNDFYALRPGDIRLFNSTFRNFSQRSKHGRDFRIVSPLYEIPKQELKFAGKEIIDGDICWKVAE